MATEAKIRADEEEEADEDPIETGMGSWLDEDCMIKLWCGFASVFSTSLKGYLCFSRSRSPMRRKRVVFLEVF